jgi:hypothetical protein
MSIAIFDSEGFISFVRLLFFFLLLTQKKTTRINKTKGKTLLFGFVLLFCLNGAQTGMPASRDDAF